MDVLLFSICWFAVGFYAGVYVKERKGKEGSDNVNVH